MIRVMCFGVLISPVALAVPQDGSGGSESKKGNHTAELHIKDGERAKNFEGSKVAGIGTSEYATAHAPVASVATPTSGVQTPKASSGKLTRRERLRALSARIKGAEETLLYDQAAEQRAIEYNAAQRAKTRAQQARMSELAAEHEEFLKGLASTYRREQALKGRTAARRWLNGHKLIILREIRRLVSFGRRAKAAERGLEELNRSDSRLRQLVAWKRSERDAARRRQTTVVTETPAIRVPVVPEATSNDKMTKEELEIFERLFPAER